MADIEIIRGDTFRQNFTYLGDMTAWTKVWFTVKKDLDNLDTGAQVQIVETNPGAATDGLLYIEGAAPTALGNGAITVSSAPLGNLSVRIEAVETAKLIDCGNFYYDIQFQTATNTTTLIRDRCTVIGDVTRTV